jgi:hypothetical protein
MQDEQFTKLFKYIEDFRLEVNAKLENTANIQTAVITGAFCAIPPKPGFPSSVTMYL